MIFNQLSSRERKLFWFTLGVILIYFILIWLKPTWDFIHELNNQILYKQIQLLKSRRIITQKETILKEYNKFSNILESKNSLDEEMAYTLRELETLAEKTGLHLIDIKPQPIREVTFYKILTIVIEGEGNINNLTKFIYGLSSSTKFLKVKSLRLKSNPKEKGILEVQLVINRILAN